MLHEQITPDPDVEQAIADFLPVVAEIWERTARLLKMKAGSPGRNAERQEVHELTTRVQARATRLGLTTDQLLVMVNDALDLRARRGRAAPARPTARTLLARVTADQAAVAESELQVRAAQAKLAASRAALNASEGAYRAWSGGKLVEHAS
jgi:hypothetical protein